MNGRLLWALPLLALMSACASMRDRETDAQRLARYMDYAEPPVERFTYLGRIDGWTALDRYRLAVRTGVNEGYLITVSPPCENLLFATTIGLTSTGASVYAGTDSVIVGRDRCRITEIRPINYREMREARRAERGEG